MKQPKPIKAWAVVDNDDNMAICLHYLIYPKKADYASDHEHWEIEGDKVIPVLITPIKKKATKR